MAKALTWDENKRKSNLEKHGLDFAHILDFDEATALTKEDTHGRTDPKFVYSEPRYTAIGLMRGQLVVVVYSETKTGWRVISLRLATKEEGKIWEGS